MVAAGRIPLPDVLMTADATVGWNWIAAQLDNGYDISAYDLFDRIDPAKSHGRWTSTRTFNEYPTRYRLDVPRAGIAVDITASLPGQEVVTMISAPACWEGRVRHSSVWVRRYERAADRAASSGCGPAGTTGHRCHRPRTLTSSSRRAIR